MEMFSNCSGECKDCLINYTGRCLAGHGDDDFTKITASGVRLILKNEHIEEWRKEKLREVANDLYSRTDS